MAADFLAKFMRIAKEITHAERSLAVDNDLAPVDTISLSPQVINSSSFGMVAQPSLQKAIENHEAILTNNILTDASQAPVTNTNFTDLRIVVVIPLRGHGAVYLDQHIRKGIIPRETIEKLMQLGNHITDNGLEDASEDEIVEWYNSM